MNKTKILAALALPALLAACSQEAIVENTTDVVDLSSREVIENVVLNFNDGNVESRAGLGTSSWNSYAWTAEDGVGACIIDVVNGSNLDIVEYISTNYKYYYSAEGQWVTDALMVKGNYMFYAPYNAAWLGRNNIEAVLPTTQNVKVQTEDNNAIAEFYASGKPVFVGYKKLEGKSTETKVSVDMRHIFAYPLFTIVNKYDTRTAQEIRDNVAPKYQDINLVKVEISLPSSQKFNTRLVAKNQFIATELNTAASGSGLVWDAGKHEDNATSDLFPTVQVDGNGNAITASKITINLGNGFTLKGTEKLSFHAIMPAMKYTNGIVITAYDNAGNKYNVAGTGAIGVGVNLNPGYRFPAQEYTTAGEVMSSKGTLLTAELSTKNQAPTEIGNNTDFISYLQSRNSRFDKLQEVAIAATPEANQFQLQASAALTLNTEMIDALANYCMVDGSVEFNASDIAIATDVTVLSANTASASKYEFNIKSANGKTFKVIMPATLVNSAANITAKGTYVVAGVAITANVANNVKPVNVIVTNSGATLAGSNYDRLTSLNVISGASLNLTNNYNGPVVVNQGTLTINGNVVVTGTIKNLGIVDNNGVMYAETNVNRGTINALTANSVTKVASGTGVINNNNLAAVKASADQTVKWEGAYSAIYDAATNVYGLSEIDNSSTGINYVTITDVNITTSAAILAAPVKGCGVNTVVLKNATQLTTKNGGNMAAITLQFEQDCTWTGDILGAPAFTNVKARIKDSKEVTVEYATVSGTLDKTVSGYTAGKIKSDGIGGIVNF